MNAMYSEDEKEEDADELNILEMKIFASWWVDTEVKFMDSSEQTNVWNSGCETAQWQI